MEDYVSKESFKTVIDLITKHQQKQILNDVGEIGNIKKRDREPFDRYIRAYVPLLPFLIFSFLLTYLSFSQRPPTNAMYHFSFFNYHHSFSHSSTNLNQNFCFGSVKF